MNMPRAEHEVHKNVPEIGYTCVHLDALSGCWACLLPQKPQILYSWLWDMRTVWGFRSVPAFLFPWPQACRWISMTPTDVPCGYFSQIFWLSIQFLLQRIILGSQDKTWIQKKPQTFHLRPLKIFQHKSRLKSLNSKSCLAEQSPQGLTAIRPHSFNAFKTAITRTAFLKPFRYWCYFYWTSNRWVSEVR